MIFTSIVQLSTGKACDLWKELLKRADKGYNVDLTKIDEEVDKFLKEQNIN